MPATVYRGKGGAVAFGPAGQEVTQPFDAWTLVVRADAIDSSDFDQPSRNFLHDLPVANLNFSGPYFDELLNLKVTDTGEVTLFLDEEGDVGFPLTILVTDVNLRLETRGVARVEFAGVVTGNILESIADAFTEAIIL
jgi:hypothetical protein